MTKKQPSIGHRDSAEIATPDILVSSMLLTFLTSFLPIISSMLCAFAPASVTTFSCLARDAMHKLSTFRGIDRAG